MNRITRVAHSIVKDRETAGDSTEYDGRLLSLSLPRMVMFSYDVSNGEYDIPYLISHIYGE